MVKVSKSLFELWPGILLALAVTLVITFFCYHKGMTTSFSSDDYPHLLKNVVFDDLIGALTVFSEFDGREYRPMVRLSVWLNYQITQDATAFHYTNLFLHLGSVISLYFLLALLLENRRYAFFSSLLFALHPIHTTNVFFIHGRTDLVFGFFYLISLLLFFVYRKHGKDRKYYILSLLFFILGLLSKEMTISLPILLFFMLLIMDKGGWRQRTLTTLGQTSIYFLIACVYVAIRIRHWAENRDAIAGYINYDPFSMLTNLGMWSFGLFYPFDLYRMRNWFESDALAFLLILFLIAAAFLALTNAAIRSNWAVLLSDKILHLSAIWFLVTLLPIVGGNAHRWYLYIPSVSLSLFVIAIWRSTRRQAIFHIVLTAFLISYPIEILNQSEIWKKQESIAWKFLDQLREIGSDKTYYFANMPFGYKSSFLFTWNSAIDAVQLHFGFRPDIRVLSYVNLSDETNVELKSEGRNPGFRIKSDAYGSFLFPPSRRRFESENTVMKIHGLDIEVDALSPARTASEYRIHWLEPGLRYPLYYFDGERIKLLQR